MSVDAESVNVTVLKAAEDGCGIVVRGVEYAGVAQKIQITVCDSSNEFDVSPYEIFTVRIEGDGIKKTDALEG